MKSFNMLFKLEGLLLKNRIQSIVKNPKRLLSYSAYLVLMTWVIFNNIKNFSHFNSGPLFKYASGGVYVLIFMMAYGLTKKSSIYFKMSEINLLFTAPIDQRTLLMFTLLKKIPIHFITSVYTLVFLMTMIIGAFEPTTLEIIITAVGYMLVMLILEPLGFCIFAVATKLKKPSISETLPKNVLIVLGVLTGLFVVLSIKDNGFTFASVFEGLGHEQLNYLPIIGWGRALTITALTGINTMTYIYLSLMIGTYILLVVLTYLLGSDYYEDVITSSEIRNELMKDAKSGKINFKGFNFRKKTIKIKDTYILSGAIHWKKKLLTSKSDISVYFSLESVLAILLGLGSVFFISDEKEYSLYIVALVYFYIKFLFSMNSSLDKELNKHYFYTIPDSAFMKLINVTKVDVIRFFAAMVLMVVSNGLIGQHFDVAYLVLPFATTMFYTMMLISSFTLKLFFSSEDFNRLIVMFKMLQMLLILMPSVVTMIIIGVTTESLLFALLGSTAINIVVTSVFLGLSDVILNKLELK